MSPLLLQAPLPSNNPLGMLNERDLISYSFFYCTFALLGAALFFLFERTNVPRRWRVNMTIAGLICLIASTSYVYMQIIYAGQGRLPSRFRYTEWLFTVPLMCTQFYLLLRPAGAQSGSLLRLVLGGLWMISCGFFGENARPEQTILWGAISTLGYLVVLFEIWFGPLARVADRALDRDAQRAYRYLTYFVLVGWAIYPMGYMTLPFNLFESLNLNRNLVYNFGDVLNKVGFGLVVYVMARKSANRASALRRARRVEPAAEAVISSLR